MPKKNVVFNIIFIIVISSLAVKVALYKKNMHLKQHIAENKSNSIVNATPQLQPSQAVNSVQHNLSKSSTPISEISTLSANNSLIPQNNGSSMNQSNTSSNTSPQSNINTVPSTSSIVITDQTATSSIFTSSTQNNATTVATATTSASASSLGSLVTSSLLSGFYVGLNTSITTTEELPNPLYGTSINLGYKIIPNLATELTYSYMQGNQYGATVSTSSFSAAAKGIMNINPVSVYAKSGVSYQTVGSSGQITGVQCGSISLCNGSSNNYALGFASVGVTYNVLNSLAIKVENTEYMPVGSSVTGSMNTSLVGVQYNF